MIVVFSLIVSGCCLADGAGSSKLPDISSLSRDELILLRSEVDDLLSDEEISFVLPAGIYKCGEDFPVGSYTISPVADEDWSYVDFLIYDAAGEMIFSGQLDFSYGLSVGKFEFCEGYVYEARYCSSVFTTFSGITIK